LTGTLTFDQILSVEESEMATINDIFNLLTALNDTTLGRIESKIKAINQTTLGRIEVEIKDIQAHIG
jgi:hypothetical protein